MIHLGKEWSAGGATRCLAVWRTKINSSICTTKVEHSISIHLSTHTYTHKISLESVHTLTSAVSSSALHTAFHSVNNKKEKIWPFSPLLKHTEQISGSEFHPLGGRLAPSKLPMFGDSGPIKTREITVLDDFWSFHWFSEPNVSSSSKIF